MLWYNNQMSHTVADQCTVLYPAKSSWKISVLAQHSIIMGYKIHFPSSVVLWKSVGFGGTGWSRRDLSFNLIGITLTGALVSSWVLLGSRWLSCFDVNWQLNWWPMQVLFRSTMLIVIDCLYLWPIKHLVFITFNQTNSIFFSLL